jgi:hypothetical protein
MVRRYRREKDRVGGYRVERKREQRGKDPAGEEKRKEGEK